MPPSHRKDSCYPWVVYCRNTHAGLLSEGTGICSRVWSGTLTSCGDDLNNIYGDLSAIETMDPEREILSAWLSLALLPDCGVSCIEVYGRYMDKHNKPNLPTSTGKILSALSVTWQIGKSVLNLLWSLFFHFFIRISHKKWICWGFPRDFDTAVTAF